jgi:hypothetical protein
MMTSQNGIHVHVQYISIVDYFYFRPQVLLVFFSFETINKYIYTLCTEQNPHENPSRYCIGGGGRK